MKIERRADTPAPAVQQPLSPAAAFYAKYGTRILIGITLVVLAFVIFRYRTNANQRRLSEAQAALMRARNDLNELQQTLLTPDARAESVALQRDQFYKQSVIDLTEVLADAGENDAVLRAEAYATRGDINWQMANAPTYPEATTRPQLNVPMPTDQLLKNAETDYRTVIAQYPQQQTAWTTAQIGLAAIAENRHDWDEAAKHYNEIINRKDAAAVYQSMAQQHLGMLAQIKQQLQIGPLATSQPVSTEPSASTEPSIAATLPTTSPANRGGARPTTMP